MTKQRFHFNVGQLLQDKAGNDTRLTYVGEAGKSSSGERLLLAACSCGSPVKPYRLTSINRGKAQSCGCFNTDQVTKHGLRFSKHYHRASNIFKRCQNPENPRYPDYGGRGIEVRFTRNELILYLENLPGFFEGAELDRINNDGHYEKGNLRWVTRKENCNNKVRTGIIAD
jgi:hypothetical protein